MHFAYFFVSQRAHPFACNGRKIEFYSKGHTEQRSTLNKNMLWKVNTTTHCNSAIHYIYNIDFIYDLTTKNNLFMVQKRSYFGFKFSRLNASSGILVDILGCRITMSVRVITTNNRFSSVLLTVVHKRNKSEPCVQGFICRINEASLKVKCVRK